MSQNSQNRFAALSPSSADNTTPKGKNKKNKRTKSNEDGEEPLLNDRKLSSLEKFKCQSLSDHPYSVSENQQEQTHEGTPGHAIVEESKEAPRLIDTNNAN